MIDEGWARTAELLSSSHDLLDERPQRGGPLNALASRGWDEWLLALSDADLDGIEIAGVDASWPASAPSTLRALVDAVREATAVSSIAAPSAAVERPARRREPHRKRIQVDAMASLIGPLADGAGRVVDVGSGHGHLSRELAARVGRAVVGLERSAARVQRARALEASGEVSFRVSDVLVDGLGLEAGDLAVGLHACGELGDAIVIEAARAGAGVALVGCCLQKQRGATRRALAKREGETAIDLDRELLGLSNLTPRDRGVEATRAENLAARARRVALHLLLSEHVPGLRFGAVLEGLNRRAAHAELGVLVQRAFRARSLPAPSPREVERALDEARALHARARRLSVPRNLFGRVIEVFVAFDRARYLAERGRVVEVGALFPAEVSARNLVLLAP
ncbi:MAG: methyltransferase [Polyangiaceae bacterium]